MRLQTLRENPRYFVVTVPEVDLRRPPDWPAAAADAAFASLRQQLG
jgi:hypothetical protein